MLTIIETPHRGRPLTWTCANREEFCVLIMRAYPRGTWYPDWTFEEFRAWYADEFRQLEIIEGE